MANRLILIDGHAVLFRAFYAYPTLTTQGGELVNAVYGFTSIILNVIRELAPTHIALAFDLPDPTFRHVSYREYKANRAETPQELIDQESRVREIVQAFNIPIYTQSGFEADDVIGTICQQVTSKPLSTKNLSTHESPKTQVIIVTGDKDALQLVVDEAPGGSVAVYIPGRNKLPSTIYDEEEVARKFEGLTPSQIPDLKGLAGDQSDNIPGVKGIGQKTAIKLLLAYKSIEQLYEAIQKTLTDPSSNQDMLQQAKKMALGKSAFEKLIDGRMSAFESKQLATIMRDVPIQFELEKALLNDYDKHKVLDLFDQLGFASLIHKLPNDRDEQSIQEALF